MPERIVSGRFWIFRHVVHLDTHSNVVLFDLYDPQLDRWCGTFNSFQLAFAACREATRKGVYNE